MFSGGWRIAAIVLFLPLFSLWYHGGLWRGVRVTDAGEATVNGYYYWDGVASAPQSIYVQDAVAYHALVDGVAHDAFSLSLHAPHIEAGSHAMYPEKNNAGGAWVICALPCDALPQLRYMSKETGEKGTLSPPTGGWFVPPNPPVKAPPPTLIPAWRQVPDPDTQKSWWSQKKKGSNIREFLDVPATCLLLFINLWVAWKLFEGRVPVENVAVSYDAVVHDCEYWRLVTASFSHFEIIHLGFNMMSLYNLKGLEMLVGPIRYLYLSLGLVASTMLTVLALQWWAIRRGSVGQGSGKAVGYSCVLFALMTRTAVLQGNFQPIPFASLAFDNWNIPLPFKGWTLPVNIGPFVLLALVQVIMPRAHFLGHLAGILVGYPLAWGWMNWLQLPLLCSMCTVLMVIHYRKVEVANTDQAEISYSMWLRITCLLQFMLTVGRVYASPWTVSASEILLLSLMLYTVYILSKSSVMIHASTITLHTTTQLLRAICYLCMTLVLCDLISIGSSLGKVQFLGSFTPALFAMCSFFTHFFTMLATISMSPILKSSIENMFGIRIRSFGGPVRLPFSGTGFSLRPTNNGNSDGEADYSTARGYSRVPTTELTASQMNI